MEKEGKAYISVRDYGIIQLLDFSKFDTEDVSKIREEVKLQINSFVEKNIMSLEEIETININWI